jgi:cell shape-determining protein MreC
MPRNLKTLAQLQTEINKLKQEKAQLRLLLKIIIDTAYQAVNGPEPEAENQTKETNHE